MAQTESELGAVEALPSGFQSTFYEADRLRRLAGVDPQSTLSDTVDEFSVSGSSSTLTESNVIDSVVEGWLTQFITPERTIEFPGLGLSREENLIQKFAAKYKNDNDTPSGTIKDVARAGTDDILFTFATPEVYSEISGTQVNDFLQTGLTAGNRLDVVGDAGVDEGANTAGNSLQLDPDEYLFFTGDFIDLSEGKSVVTATELADVDGEDFGPVNGLFSSRLSGTHILTTQGTYATATVDIDAKVYDDGDAEVVPVAFYMAPGSKAPDLV